MAKKAKLPADTNKRAKAILDFVIWENPGQQIDLIKAAAAALGRWSGLKGGKSRAQKLSAKKRSEIAKKAAQKRWGKGKLGLLKLYST